MEIIEEAKSKINLSLNLTGKKENNFHQLLSFICFSNFSDQLILTKSDFFDYEILSPFLDTDGSPRLNQLYKIVSPT